MKRLVTCLWIAIAALCFGAPTANVIPDDLEKADWILIVSDTNGHSTKVKLARERIHMLVKILNSNAAASPSSSPQPPGLPPRPKPDLIIEIQDKDRKLLAQILGFNHDLIGFREFSISDKTIVAKFYEATKQEPRKDAP
jgi:hypothetical protein